MEDKDLYTLFKEYKKGNNELRETIILNSMHLVKNEVLTKFSDYLDYSDDLIAVGNIGLLIAIDTFSLATGDNFYDYIINCIDSQIYSFIKKTYNSNNITLVNCDNRDNLIDPEVEIEKEEIYKTIRNIIDNLPKREQELIKLKFGFYDDKPHLNKDLATLMNLPIDKIAKISEETLSNIGNHLVNLGLMEVNHHECKTRNNCLAPFYDYFSNYDKSLVDDICKNLSADNLFMIKYLYGNNLDKGVFNINNDYLRNKFIYTIVPKIQDMLNQHNFFNIDDNSYGSKKNDIDLINNYSEKVLIQIKKISFKQLCSFLEPKKAIIFGLRFGHIDGKYTSIENISRLVNLPTKEVTKIIIEVLKYFIYNKSKINNIIEFNSVKINTRLK